MLMFVELVIDFHSVWTIVESAAVFYLGLLWAVLGGSEGEGAAETVF